MEKERLTILYLPVVNSLAASSDKQDQEWKANVCRLIAYCNDSNEQLSLFLQKHVKDLKDVAADKVFNLRDPKNLTSVVDLYQELTIYTRIYHMFKSSMAAYIAVFKQVVAITKVKNDTDKYFERLSNTIIRLNHTTDKLMEVNLSFHQASENITYLDAGCLSDPHSIHICNYYVTEKLSDLLNQMVNIFPDCLSTRKGISSGKKEGKGKKNKGKKNKGKKKDKKKGKNGGKGKGKGKQKKNASNKRNKVQETTPQ